MKLSGGFKAYLFFMAFIVFESWNKRSELLFHVVIQGHHHPLPGSTSPRRPGLELLLALGLQHPRVLVMRVRARLLRTRIQLGQVRLLG